jgi:hypothetical protein
MQLVLCGSIKQHTWQAGKEASARVTARCGTLDQAQL